MFIVYLLLFVLGEVALGFIGTITSLFWSFEWFGDIWHQNKFSSPFIPLIGILIINIILISTICYYLRLKIQWWYYLIVIFGYIAGIGVTIIIDNLMRK